MPCVCWHQAWISICWLAVRRHPILVITVGERPRPRQWPHPLQLLFNLGTTLKKHLVNPLPKSISASTLIPDRFTFAIVISGEKAELSVSFSEQSNSKSSTA